MDRDKIDNRRVARGEKEKTKHDADDDGKDVTEWRSERATHENLAHVAQHVIAHAFGTGRVDVTTHDLQSAQRVRGQSEQRGEDADFDHDPQNRRRRRSNDTRFRIGAAGVELHYAGGVGDGLDAGKSEHDSDEPGPVLRETPVQWL